MSHAEQKSQRSKLTEPSTEPSKDAPRASDSSNAQDENYRKQREAIDYDNHEDYPEGSKDSDSPAKKAPGAAEDEALERKDVPERRLRDPKP